MRPSSLASVIILVSSSVPAFAQSSSLAYASDRDLAQAARCSVLNLVIDARARGYAVRKVEGEAVFKRVRQQGQKVSGSATLPFSVIELSPSAEASTARSNTVTQTVDLGIDPRQTVLPAACQALRVRTLDRRGRGAASRPGILFTADQLLTSFAAGDGLLSKETVGQTFSSEQKYGGGLKLNLFGLVKIGYDRTQLDASRESGYTFTIFFDVGSSNSAGVRYDPGSAGKQK